MMARMLEKQEHFSGLITSLNLDITCNQHPTDELQSIITSMQDNLTYLINSTEAMTLELTQLEETHAQLAEKDQLMREAVDSILASL